jgi:hypothetical protein
MALVSVSTRVGLESVWVSFGDRIGPQRRRKQLRHWSGVRVIVLIWVVLESKSPISLVKQKKRCESPLHIASYRLLRGHVN